MIENTRFNSIIAAIGMRGTGKTLFFLGSKYAVKMEDKKLNIPGVFEIYEKKKMKILIIDTLDHPSYKNIGILSPAQFLKFNSGISRAYMEPEKILQLVNQINKTAHFNNTLLVFEDAGKYTDKILPKVFNRLIIDSKQRNIDIIFIYHSWSHTPNDVFRKGLDAIQLFKTSDAPKVRQNYLPEYDKVYKAFEDVKNNGNNFYSKFIELRTN
jgi:hypothetical protein